MKVSPSLLSADFACLQRDIEMINNSEADYLHLDIMDGVFVPNISFGFPVMKAVAGICKKPLDVHLMIVEPEKWIAQVKETGAAIMNVHLEACRHLHATVQKIHAAGMMAGVTLNPATPVCMLNDVIADVDMVLLMSVNPGFSGQPFIQHTVEKTRELKALIDAKCPSDRKPMIQIDGGINRETAVPVRDAGADMVVAGNYVFKSENPMEAISYLKSL